MPKSHPNKCSQSDSRPMNNTSDAHSCPIRAHHLVDRSGSKSHTEIPAKMSANRRIGFDRHSMRSPMLEDADVENPAQQTKHADENDKNRRHSGRTNRLEFCYEARCSS